MSFKLEYQAFGEDALIIYWPQKINSKIRTDIHQFDHKIKSLIPNSILETVPAYCSLTLFLKSEINKRILIDQLKNLYSENSFEVLKQTKIWDIPVCYDSSLGIDLENMAKTKNLSIEEIIQLHTKETYVVDFLGFLPGFPYLSGLNPLLEMPRLSKPRIKIPQGSVAIGGKQTGIYPVSSPGGWHIIGQTPVTLFNPYKRMPCLLRPLDKIKFNAITLEEFKGLLND